MADLLLIKYFPSALENYIFKKMVKHLRVPKEYVATLQSPAPRKASAGAAAGCVAPDAHGPLHVPSPLGTRHACWGTMNIANCVWAPNDELFIHSNRNSLPIITAIIIQSRENFGYLFWGVTWVGPLLYFCAFLLQVMMVEKWKESLKNFTNEHVAFFLVALEVDRLSGRCVSQL